MLRRLIINTNVCSMFYETFVKFIYIKMKVTCIEADSMFKSRSGNQVQLLGHMLTYLSRGRHPRVPFTCLLE